MQTYVYSDSGLLELSTLSFAASTKATMDRSLHCLHLSSQQGLVGRDLVNLKLFHLNGRCRLELLAIFAKKWAGKRRTNFYGSVLHDRNKLAWKKNQN